MDRTPDEATFGFSAAVWRWEAQDAWRFVALPEDLVEAVRLVAGPPRGFGSVRVVATIGATTWRTSVFPDSTRRTFVLPVKRAVRDAEGVEDGDVIDVMLEVDS